MKQAELENLSKDELFEVMKRKCKSRAKLNFWGGVTIIILVIITMIVSLIHNKGFQNIQFSQIVAFIFLSILVCIGVWSVLNNYRFLKRQGSLDTPDQLLYWYHKKVKNDVNISFVSKLLFLGFIIYQFWPDERDEIPTTIFVIVLLLILVYLGRGSSLALSRDQTIIEQLERLTEKE